MAKASLLEAAIGVHRLIAFCRASPIFRLAVCESWKRDRKADMDTLASRTFYSAAQSSAALQPGEWLEKYPKHLTAFTWKLNDSIFDVSPSLWTVCVR